jgi:hypothetical protein
MTTIKKKAKSKVKVKVHKVRVVKVEKLDEGRHLIATEFEVHGPEESLPELPIEPLEITPEDTIAEPESPKKHWHDFLTKGW